MTDYKVGKLTWSILIEKKASINDFGKKTGLYIIIRDGCIKCRKVVSFDGIDLD